MLTHLHQVLRDPGLPQRRRHRRRPRAKDGRTDTDLRGGATQMGRMLVRGWTSVPILSQYREQAMRGVQNARAREKLGEDGGGEEGGSRGNLSDQ